MSPCNTLTPPQPKNVDTSFCLCLATQTTSILHKLAKRYKKAHLLWIGFKGFILDVLIWFSSKRASQYTPAAQQLATRPRHATSATTTDWKRTREECSVFRSPHYVKRAVVWEKKCASAEWQLSSRGRKGLASRSRPPARSPFVFFMFCSLVPAVDY